MEGLYEAKSWDVGMKMLVKSRVQNHEIIKDEKEELVIFCVISATSEVG